MLVLHANALLAIAKLQIMKDNSEPHVTTRSAAKAATRQRILTAAREQLAQGGAARLSMRQIADRVGLVPSALYKHVPTKDALLTELIVEAYRRLAVSISAAGPTWQARATALRAWALKNPHEFYLIYGTPVTGYQAPEETIEPAASVFRCFVEATDSPAGQDHTIPGRPVLPAAVAKQLNPLAKETGHSEAFLAGALASVSQLVGMILLELGGHFVGSVAPADEFFAWVTTVDC